MDQLRYVDHLPRQEKFLRLLWSVAWTLLVRPTPRWTLHGWRRAVLRAFGAQIGRGCKIDPSCRIWSPWNLKMGQLSALGPKVDCYNIAPVQIGSKVAVSQRAFLCTASHDIGSLLRPLTSAPIDIEDHVWVAADAMVHPGVILRQGCVVGARAVATRSTEPWMIYVGSPARPTARRIVRDAALDPFLNLPTPEVQVL